MDELREQDHLALAQVWDEATWREALRRLWANQAQRWLQCLKGDKDVNEMLRAQGAAEALDALWTRLQEEGETYGESKA